jgi:hypothetical protein
VFTPQMVEAMIKASGGVPVVVGAVSTWGHRDTFDEPMDNGGAEAMVTQDVITVATGILPALSHRAAISVNGENLVVGQHQRIDDGALTRIEIEAP